MKNIKLAILTILVAGLLAANAFADSPLTSTKFSDAYMDEPIVIAAENAKGVINGELMDFLSSEYNPVDVKMAVINRLGWKISGQNNSKLYMQHLLKKRGYSNERKLFRKGSADDLLSMAYLKAMDNYFEVDEALKYAERALRKNRESRTFQLIAGLVRAQKAMDSKWCNVYQITDRIRNNKRLMNDMRTKAVDIVYDYMDIYGESCKEST